MQKIDLSRLGRKTPKGGFLLGPWQDWLPYADTEQESSVLFSVPASFVVRSTDSQLVPLLERAGEAGWSGGARAVQSLILYACPDRHADEEERVVRNVLEDSLQFFTEWVGVSVGQPILLDYLPDETDGHGLSMPGLILIRRDHWSEANPLLIAHEAAHQWWGPQLRGGVPRAHLWTESAAEAMALLYLLRRAGDRVNAWRPFVEAFNLHRYALKKEPRLSLQGVSLPVADPGHYSLVYGSAVLLYLLTFLHRGAEQFGEAMRRLAVSQIGDWREWFEELLPGFDADSFQEQPAEVVERLLHQHKDDLRRLVGR